MRFVSIPSSNVAISVWETRVQDFAAFVKATGYNATEHVHSIGNGRWWGEWGDNWEKPGFEQTPDCPVVCISWDDAKAFCEWLTKKEQADGVLKPTQRYRLPTAEEWSRAAGPTRFPWGDDPPIPQGGGNYAGLEVVDEKYPTFMHLNHYRDDFPRTAPVGSFKPNWLGIYDMGGNAEEWCEDWVLRDEMDQQARQGYAGIMPADYTLRRLRGGSWYLGNESYLNSSLYQGGSPRERWSYHGFRCVLIFD